MPINDPTPPVVYTDHANTIDWSDFVYIWDRLSDFWDLIDNRGLVTAFWEGWYTLSFKMTQYLDRHRYDHTLFSQFYWGGSEPYPIEIELSAANRVSGTAHSYYIDPIVSYDPDGNISKTEYVRDIYLIEDFLQAPTLSYRTGTTAGCFSYITGIHDADRGIVTFYDANYLHGDRLWSDNVYRMWVTGWRAKSRDDIEERFGPFVDYGGRVSDQSDLNSMVIEHEKAELGTLLDITGLFYVQEFGPVIPNLEIGLYIINDWPYAPLDATVHSIDGTDSITLKLPDDTLYEIDNISGLVFQTETATGWVDLQVGDSVIGMTPLVHGLDIIDIFTDPYYWVNLPISRAESWHTFAVLFSNELECDGSSAAFFPFDCAASMAFLMRNKPIGDKPYVAVVMDLIPEISAYTSWCPLIKDISNIILDLSGFWDLLIAPSDLIDETNAFAMPWFDWILLDEHNWFGALRAPNIISYTVDVDYYILLQDVIAPEGDTSYHYAY